VDFAEAALLGLIQGLTEFLPVSSSGHLVLAQALLGAERAGIVFEVALHAATLLAVVVFYRARIARLVRGALGGEPEAWRYVAKLGLASVPAACAGLLAGDFFEARFEQPGVAAACLLLTGVVVWTTRRTRLRAEALEPSWTAAWWIGCAQAIAILPGISRSGATVAAALALGVAPVPAAAFSFLMSIPAVAGAALLQLPHLEAAQAHAAIAAGAVVALASGVAALALFVRVLRAGSFHRFAYYVWAVGALMLFWSLRSG
jgi:undecaprenyl-diphosphatase